MKIIKFWHVKLYQIKESPAFSSLVGNGGGGVGVFSKLLHEGYSKDEVVLPHRDGLIKLLSDPCGLEVKTVRADVVDSIVCTPVYEDDGMKVADADEKKKRYNYDTFKAASKPLIQWLNENANPHASVIIDCTGSVLLVGEIAFNTKEFLKD